MANGTSAPWRRQIGNISFARFRAPAGPIVRRQYFVRSIWHLRSSCAQLQSLLTRLDFFDFFFGNLQAIRGISDFQKVN